MHTVQTATGGAQGPQGKAPTGARQEGLSAELQGESESPPANRLDPEVAVTERRFVAAKTLSELQGGIGLCKHLPLSQALARCWANDAHLLVYTLVDEDGTRCRARVSKRSPLVTELLARGGRVEVPLLAFDFDNPGKCEWTHESRDAFLDQLRAATEGTPLEPTALYTTKHGARLVYVLTKPVDHLAAEGLIRGIMRDFKTHGVVLDEACSDWTRLFRLPQVLRDGARSEASPTFMLLDGGPELDASTIRMAEASADVYAEVNPYNGAQPDPDEVRALLVVEGKNGKTKDSDLVKTARTYLQGREAYGVCFDHRPIDVSKGWNNGVTRLVGQVVGMLGRQDGMIPEGIFALLYAGLEQLQAEEDRGAKQTDWFQKGWDLVARMWANEMAQIEADNKQRELKATDAECILQEIVEQQRSIYGKEVPEDPEQALAWLRGRLFVAAPRGLFLMTPTGTYTEHPVTYDQLHAAIRRFDMEAVIETRVLRGKTWALRNPREIVNAHGIDVHEVHRRIGVEAARIEAIGNAGRNALVLPLYKLRELEPEYSPNVDAWLSALFGHQYEQGVEWLASAIEVAAPTCGLALTGASSAGKGMFAAGLAECFENPSFNTGEEAFAQFNANLLENPVVFFDEALPQASHGRRPDALIRALVSGGNGRFEQKGKDAIHATAYHRVIVAANNPNVLGALTRGDLTGHDREAIDSRFLVIEVGDDAPRFLRERGNYRLTAGWVAGNVPSRYVLAKHIRFLHSQRKDRLQHGEGRFLVSGGGGLLRNYLSNNPKTVAFVEAICALTRQQGRSALLVRGGEGAGFYVLRSAFSSPGLLKSKYDPTPAEIEDAGVRGGMLEPARGTTRRLLGRAERWRRIIDLRRVREIAQANGFEHVALDTFMVEIGELDVSETDRPAAERGRIGGRASA